MGCPPSNWPVPAKAPPSPPPPNRALALVPEGREGAVAKIALGASSSREEHSTVTDLTAAKLPHPGGRRPTRVRWIHGPWKMAAWRATYLHDYLPTCKAEVDRPRGCQVGGFLFVNAMDA